MSHTHNIRTLLVALSTILLHCCTADKEVDNNTLTLGETAVLVTLQMPTSAQPSTYGITAPNENQVEKIDVFAFKADPSKPSGWAYQYKAEGSAINNAAGGGADTDLTQKTFRVSLRKDEQQQLFVIVANARQEVQNLATIAVGADKEALLARLVMEKSGPWEASSSSFTPLPMWGETTATINNNTSNLSGIKVIHSVACIDVVTNTTAVPLELFTLEEVHLYNSKEQGHLVPKKINIDPLTSTLVIAATQPTSATNNESLFYSVPLAKAQDFSNAIYLFEAEGKAKEKASEATCVIVGGSYKGGSTTYYRLDFFAKTPTDKHHRDILRNHKYRMNINEVSGPGFESPEEAFNSTTLNMLVEVLDWDKLEANIVVDGQRYLSVQPKMTYDFMKEANSDVIKVKTNVPDGFQVIAIQQADGTPIASPNLWLQVSEALQTPLGKNETETSITISVTQNNEGAPRTGHIIIKAGRVQATIIVNQSVMEPVDILLSDGNGTDITGGELIFSSHAGSPSLSTSTQNLNVLWLPTDAPVNITNTNTGKPFTGTGVPTTTIPAGTGTHTYTITTDPFTPTELGSDPFAEKESTVEFTTTDGTISVTKHVKLRHINYNLMADVREYMLDGEEQTFKVKANFDWEITDVQDPDRIFTTQPAIGTIGNANTTAGTHVMFKMATSNLLKEGKTATITFTSQIDGFTWQVKVKATNSIYAGMFGGALVEVEPGKWRFERALYVHNTGTTTGITWGPVALANITSNWGGKGNTLAINKLNTVNYPAANLCFQKNENWSAITSTTDTNYNWYLPAQKQLMGIYAIHSAFDSQNQFAEGGFWSATEYNMAASWHVNFESGQTKIYTKLGTPGVRCVREI